jgi:t-SNARE complex subunit (syntaxin)
MSSSSARYQQLTSLEKKMMDLEEGHLSLKQEVTTVKERQDVIETRLEMAEQELKDVRGIAESLQHSVRSLDSAFTVAIEELKKTPGWLRQVQIIVVMGLVLWLIVAYIIH